MRIWTLRVLIIASLTAGLAYLVWRWGWSVNWHYWWIGVPLVLAETYSFVEGALFGMTIWRAVPRPAPLAPNPAWTVDVFITTYDEDVDLVERTAAAAVAIRHPHTTHVLDDGDRPEVRAMAERLGIGYITRTNAWRDQPRHAKAGNLNNALLQTAGEFVLILDADQVPYPQILSRLLGYFQDDSMAIVQSPQWFHNVPRGDPFGSQAPLFFGPIQQGKDGWNAAFFCGTNAVVRRDALMQLGLREYVRAQSQAVRAALRSADAVLRSAIRTSPDSVRPALSELLGAASWARNHLDAGEPLAEVTRTFQRAAARASRSVVAGDLATISADLATLEVAVDIDDLALDTLAARDWSPLAALEAVERIIGAVNAERLHEAQPIMPMATLSVTEDMATCMRLHAAGWHTAYHDEILAEGLAPQDLGTAMNQRLRWCQGTMQVFFKENPLFVRGLSWPQRLMYFNTMWSYLSGFTAIPIMLAPFLYLVFGATPVRAWGGTFLEMFIPYFLLNQLLFVVVGWGRPTWRAQQYALAMFPVWIRGSWAAFRNVFFGAELGFVVTPKARPQRQPYPWRLVAWQGFAVGALVVGSLIGGERLLVDRSGSLLGTAINWLWVTYDVLVVGVVFTAARNRPKHRTHDRPNDRPNDRPKKKAA